MFEPSSVAAITENSSAALLRLGQVLESIVTHIKSAPFTPHHTPHLRLQAIPRSYMARKAPARGILGVMSPHPAIGSSSNYLHAFSAFSPFVTASRLAL
jgi:hypothetical protein